LTPNALTETAAYTYSKLAFTLKCNGITTPSTTNTADFVVTHKATSTIVSGNKTSVALSLVGASAPTNVVLTATLALKKTTDAGLHTSYVFNLKNTGTASLSAGYYIIVEFST